MPYDRPTMHLSHRLSPTDRRCDSPFDDAAHDAAHDVVPYAHSGMLRAPPRRADEHTRAPKHSSCAPPRPSQVYDAVRTRKGPWTVKHLVNMHGTRYTVDNSRKTYLTPELAQGRQRIRHWVKRRRTA